jgi:hypothetical protein
LGLAPGHDAAPRARQRCPFKSFVDDMLFWTPLRATPGLHADWRDFLVCLVLRALSPYETNQRPS